MQRSLFKILWVALFSVPCLAFAQMPFPPANMGWADETYNCFPCHFSYAYYQTGKDSTYNGLNYTLLESSYPKVVPVGAFRQDSVGRVYYISPGSIDEILLYDFGAEEGDTIDYGRNYGSEPLFAVVDLVDSVSMAGVNNRKRWHINIHDTTGFATNYSGDEVVEGIGSMRGLLYPKYGFGRIAFESGYRLHCVYENSNPVWGSCFAISTEEEPEEEITQIYPNPASLNSDLTIKNLPAHATHYNIWDTSGRLIRNGIISRSTASLKLTMQHAGLYLLMIEGDGNVLVKEKFLIQP